MRRSKKLKASLTEVKRMQELAGILKEQSSGAGTMKEFLSDHSRYETAILSAFRDYDNCDPNKKRTYADNISYTKKLKSDLLGKGYKVIPVDGQYKGGSEKSFIAVNEQNSSGFKQTILSLGNKYEQDSVMHSKPNGHYTFYDTSVCSGAWPGKGNVSAAGKPKPGYKDPNGWTVLPDGSYFSV